MNVLFELFLSFFRIGALSVGGGYAAVPLIQNQVVDLHGWLDLTQFADITAIAEMTPGPIAINAATFVGTRIAGLPGAVVATAGCIAPSCVIVLLLAYVYYRFRGLDTVKGVLSGVRPVAVALIASAGISLMILAVYGERALPADLSAADPIAAGIFLAGFLFMRIRKPNPLWVMFGSGLLGLLLYSL